MKKVLSLVLVIAMVLSSFSFAFAANFEDVEGDYEEAVNVLAALGVIDGYEEKDGTFTYKPEQVVTRAEMAKLIVEILGYGDLVAGSASNFADTQGHWADPWIALAAGRGLVIGTGDGNFTPNRQVSYDEAITMVVRALGYTDNSNELKGMTWPTNFKVKASELKLLDGVKLLAGGADRGGVAQLLFNALDATLVTVDTDGNLVYLKDPEKKDLPLLSRLADKVELKPVKAEYTDPDHKNYKGDVVDLYQYMYQNITVYEKDDVVVFVKSVNSLVLTGTVTKVTDTSITIEDANEDKYTFDTVDKDDENTVDDFMYNMGEAKYVDNFGKLFEDEVGAEVTLVLEGEDGDKIKDDLDVWAIVATKASGYVQVADVYEKDELTLDAIYLPKDGKVVDFDNLVIKGDADSLEDIEEDDVLGVFVPLKSGDDDYFETKAADKMTIIVARETVEGRITRKSGSDYTIGGKVYGSNPFSNPDLSAGDEGLFYLDHEGNIFAFEEEGSSTPANYALVIEPINGYQTPGGTVLADPKVKVLTAAGEEVTYVIDKKTDIKDIDGDVIVKAVTENEDDEQELEVNLFEGQVIKYSLNSGKAINKLTYIDMGYDDDALELKTTVNAFNLAKNAAIFNVPGEVEDAEVIGADDLDKEIVAFRFRNTKGEIEVLVVIEGGAEEEGIFALITKGDAEDNWAWDEDEETDVIEYTAYVDGKKVFYLKHKDFDFDGDDEIDANPYIWELKLSGGKLKVVDYVEEEPAYGFAENSRVTNSIKDDNTGEVFFLADDVVVYVLKDNGSFDKVGTKSDIRGKYFMLYDTVDADQDYDIVVVCSEDIFD